MRRRVRPRPRRHRTGSRRTARNCDRVSRVPRPLAYAGSSASKVWEERFGEQAYLPLADAAFAAALKEAELTPDRGRASRRRRHARPRSRAFAASDGRAQGGGRRRSVRVDRQPWDRAARSRAR